MWYESRGLGLAMMGKAWSRPQPGLWVPLRMGDNCLPCTVTPPALGQIMHFPSTQKGLQAKPFANTLIAPITHCLLFQTKRRQ